MEKSGLRAGGGQVPARIAAIIYLIPILDLRLDSQRHGEKTPMVLPKFSNAIVIINKYNGAEY